MLSSWWEIEESKWSPSDGLIWAQQNFINLSSHNHKSIHFSTFLFFFHLPSIQNPIYPPFCSFICIHFHQTFHPSTILFIRLSHPSVPSFIWSFSSIHLTLSIDPFISPCMHASIYPPISIHCPTQPSIHLSIYPSIYSPLYHLPTHPSTLSSVPSSIHSSIYPTIHFPHPYIHHFHPASNHTPIWPSKICPEFIMFALYQALRWTLLEWIRCDSVFKDSKYSWGSSYDYRKSWKKRGMWPPLLGYFWRRGKHMMEFIKGEEEREGQVHQIPSL